MSKVATTPGGAVIPIGGAVSQTALARKLTYGMCGLAGLLLLGAGGGFYLINGQIQSAQATESDRQATVGNEQQIAQRYDVTLADYNGAAAQLRYLEKPGAVNTFVPTLLPQMQKLAETFGCQVSSMTPGALTSGGGSAASTSAATPASGSAASTPAATPYQTMSLTMSLSGTYNEIMRFVYSLTRFPKIVTVKSIALHPAAGGSGPSQVVSADLNMTAYVFTAPDDKTTTQSAAGASTVKNLGSVSATRQAQDDIVTQSMQRPAAQAMSVQRGTEERVNSSGLQAQPTPPTLPTNPSLRK